jgi:hypothetical protein
MEVFSALFAVLVSLKRDHGYQSVLVRGLTEASNRAFHKAQGRVSALVRETSKPVGSAEIIYAFF